MATKLYVGNLPYGVSDTDLEAMFAPHGTVQSAQVIMDRETGRSKGFGFVEMENSEQAQVDIKAMNGQDSNGHQRTEHVEPAAAELGRPQKGAGKGGQQVVGRDRRVTRRKL